MPCATPVSASRPAFEAREDQVALRPLDVAQDAEDVDLEVLELGAFEHGAADADHARLDLFDRHQRRRRPGSEAAEQDGERQRRGGSS